MVILFWCQDFYKTIWVSKKGVCLSQPFYFIPSQPRDFAYFRYIITTWLHAFSSLDDILVDSSFFHHDHIFLPLCPISVGKIACDLFPQWLQIILDNRPHDVGVNLIISMCQVMAHFGYHLPWCLRMSPAECFGQIVNGLAYYHGIINDTAKQQLVGGLVIACHPIAALQYDVDGIHNMKEAIPIFRLLSHKSGFCRVPHFRGQILPASPQSPSPPCGRATFQGHSTCRKT